MVGRASLELRAVESDFAKWPTPRANRRSLPKDAQLNLKRNPMPGSTKSKRQGFDFKSSNSVKADWERENEIFEKSNSVQMREYGQPSHPSEIIDTQIEAGAAKVQVPQFKVCVRCSCRRPPRAKHCAECGRCVLRKDRHCYLLASCVGFCNHKFFILALLYSVAILGIAFADIAKYLIDHLDNVIVFTTFRSKRFPGTCLHSLSSFSSTS